MVQPSDGGGSLGGNNPTSPVFVLVIVGKGDIPLYEADLSPPGKREDPPHLDQFIIHTAMDVVDELVWQTNAMYLKAVDKFTEFQVSTYVTAGHIRFMLLHKQRNEDRIRNFFVELHEVYLKTLLNPFYEANGLITFSSFDYSVRSAAKKHLLSP